MTTQQLREAFLGYFEGKQHLIRPSAPLILDDPTTFFTSAGVQPYVPAFRGEVAAPAPRVASCQKCARMGDLDGVGRQARYHTFFEMLGNFSFGDYFKEGAIEFAWEFITERLGLDPAQLWVTIFETDEEAERIWHERIGVPRERIVRFDRSDNWWPKVRWEGPCGPCSEIHIDRGEEFGCGRRTCRVNCDCDRYLELWNLVFQQYVEAADGSLTPLPAPGVDTGMGLERLASVMQGVPQNMETDELRLVMDRAAAVLSERGGAPVVHYGQEVESDVALRILADHTRAIAFLMADGATPSNEGPGYVLRMLIRRAYRFGAQLGAERPFLYAALPAVAETYGRSYPELLPKRDYSSEVVRGEEERFGETLERGLRLFEEVKERLLASGETTLPGEEAFALRATYGLPTEVIAELAREAGLTLDAGGLEVRMAEHRRISAGERKGLQLHDTVGISDSLTVVGPPTAFVGYEQLRANAQVLDVQPAGDGGAVHIILDRTPMYAERGGQQSDRGTMRSEAGAVVEVTDVLPGPGGTAVHEGRLAAGTLKAGDQVEVEVDAERRGAIVRHHTATHLLQAALRQVLGGHVTQDGSDVGPEQLRFDFKHHEAMTPDSVVAVEELVNRWVMDDLPVTVREMRHQEAVAQGALALFGEKYEDDVRVIEVGGQVSMELCGGTHAERTGQVGPFQVLSQSSSAAGVRRIMAVAGMTAVRHARQERDLLVRTAQQLNCRPDEISDRLEAQRAQIAELRRAVQEARTRQAPAQTADLVAEAVEVGRGRLLVKRLDDVPPDDLKSLADELVGRQKGLAVVLGTVSDGKAFMVAKVHPDLVTAGASAGLLLAEVAKVCGGGAGRNPSFAQAGGKHPERLDEALGLAPDLLRKQLGV